ncbi:uncharacterized protein NPIL_296481 [Nephila pilipes]|uniref:Mutator-like transposase domain-containing protein n=1 Tax=Nephila pilipes TaxID=299642 RepID=A0A8X6PH21_NEPPI|nr:uncharacterized protein NPIL_296481 [Nephila pilipes]
MRCIGKGAESAVMFCGIMNLPPPPTKFTKFNNNLLQAARETCEESMAEAVHEADEENEGGRDIAVAVDGSWQKQGFSSKNAVVTVTSVDTANNSSFCSQSNFVLLFYGDYAKPILKKCYILDFMSNSQYSTFSKLVLLFWFPVQMRCST